MKKHKEISTRILPYIIMLVVTLLGNYLYFYNGLNIGDDFKFHFANIFEQYKLLCEGKPISEISAYIGMGLGSGTRLFYAPLPHITIAFIAYIFNINIMLSYKIVMFTCIYISGIFMFCFAKRITNNKIVISLISALAFILYPYRSFDMYHRIAFAEAFAITFLPLFFMGLYNITHFKDKINVLPFVEVILGGSLLYLTHNITAVFAYIMGIIYLLFNIKNIIKLIKSKMYLPYCLISLILLIMIISVSFVSQFEMMYTDLYNVTNSKIMWTDLESVINRCAEQFTYSGFLNTYSLTYNYPLMFKTSKLILGVVTYVLSSIIFIVIDQVLKEKIKIRYINHLISIPLLFALISIADRRIEIYLSAIIFLVIYFISIYSKKVKNENDKIYNDINFYYVLTMIIACFCLMQFGDIWKVMPSMLLNIQFPWRLWSLIQLFASMFIAVLLNYLNHKKILQFVMCIVVSMFLVCNQAIIDNRASLIYYPETNWVHEIDDTILDSPIAMGFNKEYLPQILFDDDYKSEYRNSIFNKIKYKIFYDSSNVKDYYYQPVILKGNGDINVISSFADKHVIEVTSNNQSLIQMPMFYYKGYEVIAYDMDNNNYIELDVINTDGLVSFYVDEGKYEIQTEYVGTTLRNISIVCSIVASSITFIALIYAIYENLKRKNEYICN